jgi:hypothetical protein
MSTFGPGPAFGLPENMRGMRNDLKPDEIAVFIETKGVLLGWERAGVCPCIKQESQQHDPSCKLCRGTGWFYFRPPDYETPDGVEDLIDSTAKLLLSTGSYSVIKGLIQGVSKQVMPYSTPGRWDMGDTMITVRHQNKLGFRDRLTCLDTTIVFAETRLTTISSADFQTNFVHTRYRVVAVNVLRTIDKVFTEEDFKILDGVIHFRPGKAPPPGTRVAIHYLCHPTYVVTNHPHALRASQVKRKGKEPETVELPVQGFCKYEFLVATEDK